MTVNYRVTRAQRKELVKVISDTMGVKAKYLGTPSMAYQIDFFTVSKEGILSWEEADEQTIRQVLEAIASAGFEGEMPQELAEEKEGEPEQMEQTEEDQDSTAEQTEEPEEFEPIAETAEVAPGFAQESETAQVEQLPTEEENPQESENSAPRCMEENAENKAESNADEVSAEENNPDTLTISMPKAGFTPAALDNLCRIVKSKESLIKKALGAESLPIQMKEEEISFPWFTFSDYFGSAPQAKAYGHFICALCDMAKNSKRITAKEKHVDNEKYAFRCFLLRLGFIGDEFKQERRILLTNLSGSSAFRQPPEVENESEKENANAQEVDAE